MRWALSIVALSACASAPRPAPSVAPAACGHGAGSYDFVDDPIGAPLVKPHSTSPLDQLAFLDGCFSYWHIDWGWDLCFSRDADGWIGTVRSHGATAIPETEGAMEITDIGGVLHIESTAWHGDAISTDALRVTSNEIAFGIDGTDVLVLRRPHDRGPLLVTFADGKTLELPVRAKPSAS